MIWAVTPPGSWRLAAASLAQSGDIVKLSSVIVSARR
jgi:hypothetical protein